MWRSGYFGNATKGKSLAPHSTELVQRFLNWNEHSKGVKVIKCICGVLVLAGGVWLIYSAP